jgi:murein DD-endopeptidase MepM/ murein hydrolase activator NlpD
LLNAVSGVMRGIARNRSTRPDRPAIGPERPATALRIHRRAVGLARRVSDVIAPSPVALRRSSSDSGIARSSPRRRLMRRKLALRLTSDRSLPIAIALIVLLAAGVSLAPGGAQPVGAAQGAAQPVRLAVGGGFINREEFDGPFSGELASAEETGYLDDGTIYKPVAVDTSVETSADLLRQYRVRDGDTLTGIASRFGVSMMTIWWANKLTSKDDLHVGQQLVIPPVNGLVVTVKAGDTLESLATANKIEVDQVISVNGLEDTNLIVGQVLMLPGAKGAPIPTPKPTRRPSYSSGGAGVAPSYSGGPWAWPVSGGGNYISQYFHYGHYGVDIAADYGSTVRSALAGTVVYAGWASTGCGYTVIVQHSGSLYTMYCHNSKVVVSRGQSVSRAQQIARVGSSGWATGNHVHFAVSIGYPHDSGSYFVNPLRYY